MATKTWPISPSTSTRTIIAHINVNWLSPVKVRTTLIGGEKKMVVWNDLEADEKIKVYDKGVKISNGQGVYELLVSYRSGDMWAPESRTDRGAGARGALFRRMHLNNETPFNDGVAGLRVVRLLEAADAIAQRAGEAGTSYEPIPMSLRPTSSSAKTSSCRSSSISMAARSATTPRSAPLSKFRRMRRSDGTARSPAIRSFVRASPSRTKCSSATA